MEKSKIISEKLEINVTNRCNLSCKGCSHLSPICIQHNFDTEKLRLSLNRLSDVFHCETVRLLGGEPFLSPNLQEIINIVRESKICDSITIVSNGTLINDKHKDILCSVDVLEVSDHQTGINIEYIHELTKGACKLVVLDFEAFREPYSEQGTTNSALTDQIYKTCLIANVWKCYNLEDGYFYKCPQAHTLKAIKNLSADGIDVLNTPDLKAALEKYITCKSPLSACKYCLGATGKIYSQKQVNRKEWRKEQDKPTEEMLDYQFLEKLKTKANSNNHCVKSIISKEK